MPKDTKQINYHDSGMKWIVYPTDAGVRVEISPKGFRQFVGMFPAHGHIRFNRDLQIFLKQETESYRFEPPFVEKDKISYEFSHESLNRLFSIPRQSDNQDVIDFVNTLLSDCASHFSYGKTKMSA